MIKRANIITLLIAIAINSILNADSGCSDPLALNYDQSVSNNTGICEYPDNGNYNSLLFDGVYDWILIGNGENLLNIQNSFSITSYIKVKENDNQKFIFDGESTESEIDSLTSGYSLKITEDGYLQGFVGFGSSGGGNYITSDFPISYNRWHNIVFTRNGSNANLYLNGELIKSINDFSDSDINYNGYLFNSDEYLIGHYSRNGEGYSPVYFFNGNIGDLKIYSRSLTHIEAQSEVEGFTSEDSIRGKWKFNAGYGDIVFDHIGNGNHGSIVEAKWVVHEPIQLNDGNNLISFPGYLINDNTQIVLSEINDDGAEVQYLIGFWVGLFDYNGIWSGNLNNFSPYSGYWINNIGDYEWDVQMNNFIEKCEVYPANVDNNLVSFRWGTEEFIPTLDALGGEQFALENFNFIIGNSLGLFNNGDSGWSGNLNYLQRGKGYYININNPDLDFRWGFDNCEYPPEDNLVREIQNPLDEIPSEFHFSQSTNQAFYLINDIDLNEEDVNLGDYILALKDGVIIGSALWDGINTAVPAMGKDLSEKTINYIEPYEIPSFAIYRKSTGQLVNLIGHDISPWNNLGVFRIDNLREENILLPQENLLKSVYPNPFNPITSIKFNMSKEERIFINIYDIDGKEIQTILNKILSIGSHEVNFDGSDFPSGIYFLKLISGDRIESKKIMLVK